MAMTALLKFTQGANVGVAGRALICTTGTPVTILNGGDNTSVQSWRIELLYGPPGSSNEVVPGTPVVLAESALAGTPTVDITGANGYPGCLRIRLTIWDGPGYTGSSDVDIRNIGFTTLRGILMPPFQSLPDPLPLEGSGQLGAKPDELNFGGYAFGWAGPRKVTGPQGFSLVNASLQLLEDTVSRDGTTPLTGSWDVGTGNKLLSDAPSGSRELANKAYVDLVAVGGSRVVAKVRVTVNTTLSGLPGTLDAVSVVADDVVFLDGQSSALEQGLWQIKAGSWVRPAGFPTGGSASGVLAFVDQGTWADSIWLCTTNKPSDVIGSNSLAFSRFGSDVRRAPFVGRTSSAGLRGLVGSTAGEIIHVTGYSAAGDGWDGMYRWNTASVANNDGTVIVPGVAFGANTAGAHWALVYSGPITVRMFGAVGDYNPDAGTGGTNDDVGIQRALAVMSHGGALNTTVSLVIPDGIYKVTTTIDVLSGYRIYGEGRPILWAVGVSPVRFGSGSLMIFGAEFLDISILGTGTSAIIGYAMQACRIRAWIGGSFTYGVYSKLVAAAGGVAYDCDVDICNFAYNNTIHPFSAPAVPTEGVHIEGAWTNTTLRLEWYVGHDYGIYHKQVAPGGAGSLFISGMVQGTGFSSGLGTAVYLEGASNAVIRNFYGEGNLRDVDLVGCYGVIVESSFVNVRARTTKGLRVADILRLDVDNTCQNVTVSGTLATGEGTSSSLLTNQLGVVGTHYGSEVGRQGYWCAPVEVAGENLVVNGDMRRWTAGGVMWGLLPWLSNNTTKCGVGLGDTTHTNGSPYCTLMSAPSGGGWGVKLTGPLPDAYLNTEITVSCKIKGKVPAPGAFLQLCDNTIPGIDSSVSLGAWTVLGNSVSLGNAVGSPTRSGATVTGLTVGSFQVGDYFKYDADSVRYQITAVLTSTSATVTGYAGATSGTATVANNATRSGATVSGLTSAHTAVRVGDYFKYDADPATSWAQITAIPSGTSFTVTGYSGATSGPASIAQNADSGIPCENGFFIHNFTRTINQAMATYGIQLVSQLYTGVSFYISELQVCFGRSAPREYRPGRSHDGAITAVDGVAIVTGTSVPGSTDPFYGATWITGDRCLNAGGGSITEWVVTAAAPTWSPVSVLTPAFTSMIATSYVAIGSNPAASGQLRLDNAGTLKWHNAANSADIQALTVDGSDNIVLGTTANAAVTLSSTALSMSVGGAGHLTITSTTTSFAPSTVTRLTLTDTLATFSFASGTSYVAGDFISVGTSAAVSGAGRFPNNTYLKWRNFATNADIQGIGVNASDQVMVGDASYVTLIQSSVLVAINVAAAGRVNITNSYFQLVPGGSTDRFICTDTLTTFSHAGGDVVVGGGYTSWGTTPAASGSLRFPKATTIMVAKSTAGVDINVIQVADTDLLTLGASAWAIATVKAVVQRFQPGATAGSNGQLELGNGYLSWFSTAEATAASGQLRLPNGWTAKARNFAGGADIAVLSVDTANGITLGGANCAGWTLNVNAGGVLQGDGGAIYLYGGQATYLSGNGWYSPAYLGVVANPAAAGLFRLSNTQLVSWRNAAAGADIALKVGADDALVMVNNTVTTETVVPANSDALTTVFKSVKITNTAAAWTAFNHDFPITSLNGIDFSTSGNAVFDVTVTLVAYKAGDNYAQTARYEQTFSYISTTLTAATMTAVHNQNVSGVIATVTIVASTTNIRVTVTPAGTALVNTRIMARVEIVALRRA